MSTKTDEPPIETTIEEGDGDGDTVYVCVQHNGVSTGAMQSIPAGATPNDIAATITRVAMSAATSVSEQLADQLAMRLTDPDQPTHPSAPRGGLTVATLDAWHAQGIRTIGLGQAGVVSYAAARQLLLMAGAV